MEFSIRAIASIPKTLLRQPGELVRQFERVAWGSLPIIIVAGLSIGLVTWVQTRRLLVQFSAEASLPSVLAAAVLVETGPVLASILVAARLGAGLAAELSSKRLTEEIDAAEVLGASTIPSYVTPRVLACVLAVPLLTVVIDLSALLGGLSAELLGGSLSIQEYGTRCFEFLRLIDILPGTLKTTAFGLIVGLVSCYIGLSTDRSTEAIGYSATRGVVISMLLIFASNIVIVPCLQSTFQILGWL